MMMKTKRLGGSSRPRLMKRGKADEVDNHEVSEVTIPPSDSTCPVSVVHVISPDRRPNDNEIALLKQQLRDAQRVVRAVLGESNAMLDTNASIKAIRVFAKMKADLGSAKKTQQNDEGSGTDPTRIADLEKKVADQEIQLKEGLECIASLQADLHAARQEIEYTDVTDSSELLLHIDSLQAELDETQNDVEELEHERQLNMTEIVDLSKELMDKDQRIRELERENVTLQTQVKAMNSRLEDSKKNWNEEKEGLEDELTVFSRQALTVLRSQVKYHQKQAEEWKTQCEVVNAELRKTKNLLDEGVNQDSEDELEVRSRGSVSDTPKLAKVTDHRVEDLTAEVYRLKTKEQAATEAANALGVALDTLNTQISEINVNSSVDGASAAAAGAALMVKRPKGEWHSNKNKLQISKYTNSSQTKLMLNESADGAILNRTDDEIADLTMEIYSSNAAIENLSTELRDSKREIERLSILVESTEPHSPIRLSRQKSEFADLEAEIKECHARIEDLTNEVLESQTQVEDLKKELAITRLAVGSYSGSGKDQLAVKDTPLVMEKQKVQVLLNEVDELREQLQHRQTQVEDLELERNFNEAKVKELQLLLKIETKSEAEQALHAKSMEWLDLSTKLKAASADLDRTKAQKDQLEQERDASKAKVAELSELWVWIDHVKEEMESKLQKASNLARSRKERVKELEEERERYVKKATSLSIELAGLKSTIDELSEKLKHEEDVNMEKDAMIQARDKLLGKLKAANAADLDAKAKRKAERKSRGFFSKQHQGPAVLGRDRESFRSQGDADTAAGILDATPENDRSVEGTFL